MRSGQGILRAGLNQLLDPNEGKVLSFIQSSIKIASNPALRQAGMLFGSMILSMILGIAVSIVNTRSLGPEAYGKFKLLGNLFALVPTLITFGYFNSVGRLVAQPKNQGRRGALLGGGVLITSLISLLMVALLFGFSFWIDAVFRVEISGMLRRLLPLVFVFPLKRFLESYCPGDNKILALSTVRVLPSLLYLVGVLAILRCSHLSLTSALYLQLSCLAVVLIGVLCALRLSVHGSVDSLRSIQVENKACGFHLYLGALAAVASAQLFGLLIGYFVDVQTVGYYSLALAICAPLAFVGSVFGTVFFKKFAGIASIPAKVQFSAFGVCILTFIAFILLVKFVILLFYGSEYAPAVRLARIMGFGFMVHGLGDMYNRFLYAHGKGKDVRNGAFVTGAVALLFGFLLTKFLGGQGAAGAKALTSMVYFVMMYALYRKQIAVVNQDGAV